MGKTRRGRRGGGKRKRTPSAPAVDDAQPRITVSWWNNKSDHDNDEGDSKNESFPDIPSYPECPENCDAVAWQKVTSLWQTLQTTRPHLAQPTPIQLHTWSVLLSNDSSSNNNNNDDHDDEKDTAADTTPSLIQIAPTSSGKTLAFGVPLMLQQPQASQHPKQGKCQLVLVPTRELALQVQKECQSKDTVVCCCYGGVDKVKQHEELQKNKEWNNGSFILVATPGRLLDLWETNAWLSDDERVDTVVLDEADRLAVQKDLRQQVDQIFSLCGGSVKRRIVLCSATWAPAATEVWREWTKGRKVAIVKVNALSIASFNKEQSRGEDESKATKDVSETAAAAAAAAAPNKEASLSRIPSHVSQTVHVCSQHKKPRKIMTTLTKIYNDHEGERNKPLGIVFFAKIATLQYIAKLLRNHHHHRIVELHSHMPQRSREAAVENFRAGKSHVLLATDICARGLHVANVRFVVHYDFPGNLHDYVHRCGRAGRGMTTPVQVYSFFTRQLQALAPDLVKLLESTGQWIDPNLSALVEETARKKSTSAKKKEISGDDGRSLKKRQRKEETQDDDLEEDPFADLAGNRIVLQRASHVSDASSSDEDEENASD